MSWFKHCLLKESSKQFDCYFPFSEDDNEHCTKEGKHYTGLKKIQPQAINFYRYSALQSLHVCKDCRNISEKAAEDNKSELETEEKKVIEK